MVVNHHIVFFGHVCLFDFSNLQKMGYVASNSQFRDETDSHLAHSISQRDHLSRNKGQTKCLQSDADVQHHQRKKCCFGGRVSACRISEKAYLINSIIAATSYSSTFR